MLSEICNIIILIGAVIVAIKNIYNFFHEPKKKIDDRRKEEVREQVKSILEEEATEIKNEVLENMKEVLDGLLKINLEQNKSIEVLTQASKDVLRQRIMDIYNKYKFDKRMPIYMREALNELYKDYKAELGNSYIDKYYNRMKEWETYNDEGEDFLPL